MPKRVEQGYYDSQGNACLKLLLLGAKEGKGQSTTLDAIIDTGFTGFIQVPRKLAASIGVVDLRHSTQVDLADGTTISCPLGLAIARFYGRWEVGDCFHASGREGDVGGDGVLANIRAWPDDLTNARDQLVLRRIPRRDR